jgi:amino acid transporter
VLLIRHGSATDFGLAHLAPGIGLQRFVSWAAIAFAFGGLESSSLMAGEIRHPERTIPRAIVLAGGLITAIYLLGTMAVLVAVPPSQASALQAIPDAIGRAGERLGWPGMAPLAAGLLIVNGIGMVGAWLAACARLPFVTGVDRFLPAAFGRLHPRWGTPHVALLSMAFGAAVFAILGQAGTSVKGAYDALVSMGVITYFLPFVAMFAAMIRVQREPAGPDVVRVPGGKPMAIVLALIGLATTLISIVFAMIPPPGTERPAIAALKVIGSSAVLAAVGALLFALSRARKAATPPGVPTH